MQGIQQYCIKFHHHIFMYLLCDSVHNVPWELACVYQDSPYPIFLMAHFLRMLHCCLLINKFSMTWCLNVEPWNLDRLESIPIFNIRSYVHKDMYIYCLMHAQISGAWLLWARKSVHSSFSFLPFFPPSLPPSLPPYTVRTYWPSSLPTYM